MSLSVVVAAVQHGSSSGSSSKPDVGRSQWWELGRQSSATTMW